MSVFSSFIKIDSWGHFRGRDNVIRTEVTAVSPSKQYQIEFWATYSEDGVSETDKVHVGTAIAFDAVGTLPAVRLDLDGFPLQTLVSLYARIEVLLGGSFTPGDVTATFSRDQTVIEGQYCRTSCEADTCQTNCESVGCQLFCEQSAETGCNISCQIGCQGQGCQATCELACQNNAEYYCSTSTETGGCSVSCESTCQLDATVSCLSSCQESCQVGQELSGTGEIDDGSVFGGVLFQFHTGPDSGSLFLMGQDGSTEELFYKIVDPDDANETIAGTPWTSFGFSLPSTGISEMNPDGFQASDGSIWITFANESTGTAPDSWRVGWVTKSEDFGASWYSPEEVKDVGQDSVAPTIFEGRGDELIWGNVRQNKFGSQVEAWPDVGELVVIRGTITMTPADLVLVDFEELFYLPLVFRDVSQGLFGIGGMKMRYNAATEKYMCAYQQGNVGEYTTGGLGVLNAGSIDALRDSQPWTGMVGGFMSIRYLDLAIDPTDGFNVYIVGPGRRRTAETLAFLDLIFAVSYDGGYTWEVDVNLTQGQIAGTDPAALAGFTSGTANRCRFPMVEVLSTGRLVVTHVSANDAFSDNFDVWINRGLTAPELVTTCAGSCEVGYEHAVDFPVTRSVVSDIDGIVARAGVQLLLDAGGSPTPLGDIVYVGTRFESAAKGGHFYTKTVPFNATPVGVLDKPWTPAITSPPGSVPTGLPKIYQLSDGALWVLQCFFVDFGFGDQDTIYAAKSTDLGVTWTAWEVVASISDGAVGAIIEDATGPVVAWTSLLGFMYYKRFALGDAPAALSLTTEYRIILDPDKKQTVPSDLDTDLSAGVPPAYRWSGFDLLYKSGLGYVLAYAVGNESETSGQIWVLRAVDLDGLRYATPELVAPSREALGKNLLSDPEVDRPLLSNGELRLIELPGDVLVIAYNSEHTTASGLTRSQSIFRISYDIGGLWQEAVTPFEGVVSHRGFSSTLLYTDRPQGLLTSVGTSGGSSELKDANLFIQQSSAPLACQMACEGSFEVACSGSCETGIEAGGCVSSCETGVEVA